MTAITLDLHPIVDLTVGFWLLWYAVQIGLKYCVGDDDGTLLRPDSLEDAIP